MFKKATRQQLKLRLMLEGASGSGKTTAALTVAKEFGKVALIDTEHSSSRLYAGQFEFDHMDLKPPFEPERFIDAIHGAENAGYDVVVIDSITHEWSGPGGCLEIQAALGGRYQDWGKVTPRHDRFTDAIMGSKIHVICTCRSKQAYTMDANTKKVTKQGMEPQQRDGMDFLMTLVWQLNQNHLATALKDRTRLFDGRDVTITPEVAQRLKSWLSEGEIDPIIEAPIDWKARARTLYTQLPEPTAKAIAAEHGQNFEAMCHALAAAMPVAP